MFGPYAWDPEGARTLVAILRDRQRVAREGVPRLPGRTPGEIARAALEANAGDVLSAGAGHFRAMWTVDTGKAFTGALDALPRDYLTGLVDRMVSTSAELGHVPTAWTAKGHHELPWGRADNAPWLLHMAWRLEDPEFLARHERSLDAVYEAWFRRHVDARTGLIRRDVRGDWMDTVPRASSTYNNLCALRAYHVAQKLGLRSAPAPLRQAEDALLEKRWNGQYLRAHANAGDYLAADAAAPALYFDVMPAWTRRALAEALLASPLLDPVPLRAREGRPDPENLPLLTRLAQSYHTTVWLHLGLMMCVGLRRQEFPYEDLARRIEANVREHGTFLETLDGRGRPYVRRYLATEYHFTMSAGLYLELRAPRLRP